MEWDHVLLGVHEDSADFVEESLKPHRFLGGVSSCCVFSLCRWESQAAGLSAIVYSQPVVEREVDGQPHEAFNFGVSRAAEQ